MKNVITITIVAIIANIANANLIEGTSSSGGGGFGRISGHHSEGFRYESLGIGADINVENGEESRVNMYADFWDAPGFGWVIEDTWSDLDLYGEDYSRINVNMSISGFLVSEERAYAVSEFTKRKYVDVGEFSCHSRGYVRHYEDAQDDWWNNTVSMNIDISHAIFDEIQINLHTYYDDHAEIWRWNIWGSARGDFLVDDWSKMLVKPVFEDEPFEMKVTALPEPASMLLLSIGGLLIRKK